MSTITIDHRGARPLGAAERAHAQWSWLASGLVLAFAVPFLFTDLLTIDRDLYYAVYVAAVFGFFALWLVRTAESPRAVLLRNWRWGVALGLVFAGVMAAVAFGESATAHPAGWAFGAAILWRGVVYGAADGVLLSVFPILAVFAAFAVRPLGERSRRAVAGIGALALGASLLFTAVYHLGYTDFRGEKVRKPLAGDVMWSVPTLVTLSPLGAPIAHVGLHVVAVVHAYDTDTFLPPHAGAASTSAGAVAGSGAAASVIRAVPAFTAVDLSGANDVTVQVGGRRSVIVRGDDNVLPLVTTEVRDGVLVIDAERSFQTVTATAVELTVPTLDAATLSGSGTVTVAGVRGEHFTASLDGTGVLSVSGVVERLDAGLGGSGDLKLQHLVAHDATAALSGAGRLQVRATETLDASLSGTGEILYAGDPVTVTKSLTGTGVIAPQ